MRDLETEIVEKFGNRLRTRVNGVLIKDETILLIKHRMAEGRYFWNVPGGGMKFGSNARDNLKREFLEETGLIVDVGNFLCIYEYLDEPLHAVELYFEVHAIGGELKLGKDPELENDKQLITEIAYLNLEKLHFIKKTEKHRLFWEINELNEVLKWKGYFNFENNYIK
ncbi:NUDIX domain-containing protein [Mongoliitalea daihaiensis]|uniref:NUDIX domain-containing protein n=1 Tax=Mongoliitalea daihaiensis TaxID=2782006 RepID=UPI001F391BDD|nr:NUDIX domain-containing protein [Mongoliitalea daihaiensis]UJP63586.1 NUDIX domain-containing protein [Mongoliitalea daihaiensis]